MADCHYLPFSAEKRDKPDSEKPGDLRVNKYLRVHLIVYTLTDAHSGVHARCCVFPATVNRRRTICGDSDYKMSVSRTVCRKLRPATRDESSSFPVMTSSSCNLRLAAITSRHKIVWNSHRGPATHRQAWQVDNLCPLYSYIQGGGTCSMAATHHGHALHPCCGFVAGGCGEVGDVTTVCVLQFVFCTFHCCRW